jgi:hypothetical protein
MERRATDNLKKQIRQPYGHEECPVPSDKVYPTTQIYEKEKDI